ncbi:MAG: flagellin [Verrucomicrobiota bacterium]|jgi:flagellin|nr:flagellin [Verrucomicrobiota bacterium]MDP7049802.1 flagellin [Verrucomicrobiota bacterium]
MDMPITFDSALTQHTAATRRLQSVNLQMASGKREMGGVMLDPANFSMAAKFDAQVHRMDAALSNTGNAMSMLQTQDGTLRSVGNALNRMGQLAILAQDVTKSDSDRALYAEEFSQLKTMVSDSARMTFNEVAMFSDQSRAVTVDEGGSTTELPAINLQADPYAAAVADETAIDTLDNAAAALATVKEGMSQVSTDRARVGAAQASLEAESARLTEARSSLTSASSRITDVNYAHAVTKKSAAQVQLQMATAVLAHKSVNPEAALYLTL